VRQAGAGVAEPRAGERRALGPRRRRVEVTLGELIAAAFDAAGGEASRAVRLLSSPAMTRATGRHFVFTS
jgi:hypothetical protein